MFQLVGVGFTVLGAGPLVSVAGKLGCGVAPVLLLPVSLGFLLRRGASPRTRRPCGATALVVPFAVSVGSLRYRERRVGEHSRTPS